MKHCTYARKHGHEFEFGHMTIIDSGTKQEKREYIPQGTRPTLDEALAVNQMALKGKPRLGVSYQAPFSWSELYDPRRDPISAL